MKLRFAVFSLLLCATSVLAQTPTSATYTCELSYWITNGSILGGGGNVNINGSQTFELSNPSTASTKSYHMFTENKRHFFAGLYHYNNKVALEVKIFKEGMSSWQGLVSVFEGEYSTFEDKLHISSFVNYKEKIEHYKLECFIKKTP